MKLGCRVSLEGGGVVGGVKVPHRCDMVSLRPGAPGCVVARVLGRCVAVCADV